MSRVSDNAELELCREALALAAPKGVVSVPPTQGGARWSSDDWPRLDLGRTKTVQYAYLVPVDGRAELRVFPGDTLSQARVLYADAGRIATLLRLRERGWEIKPGMHFGFAHKGLAWTTATADVDQYTTYWVGRIARTRELERHEWPMFMRDLMRLGFASEGDAYKFDEAFTSTERQVATPRPGLQVVKALVAPISQTETLAREAAAALREVLGALRESATVPGG